MTELFLYEQIIEAIRSQILAGTLKAGERLPSLRQLSRNRGVSLSTVSQAYDDLEAQGLIQVRPQSGYYVRAQLTFAAPKISSIHSVPAEPALVGRDAFISEIVTALRQPELVPLGSTILDASRLPTQALKRLIQQHSGDPAVFTYAPTAGLEVLQRQIAQRSLDSTRPLRASEVVITSGCIEALNLALRALAQPGDVIAVESPTFYGILQSIESLGMQVLEIPSDPQTGLSLIAFENALQQHPIRCLVTVPSFQNPLGCCMPLAHKRALLQLANRYDFEIIEDDIYGEFYFAEPPPTLFSLDQAQRVILCSSFSKTVAPGFRVGWALPGRHRQRFLQLKRMTSLSTSSLPQLVLAAYLASGGYERYLRGLRRELAQTLQLALQTIAEYFPAGTRISEPDGGFILWLALPAGSDAMQLYQQALQAGIGLAPGALFSTSAAYDHCLRLSLCLPWGPRLEGALQTLGELACRLTAETVSTRSSDHS